MQELLNEFRTSYYFHRANREYLGSLKTLFPEIVRVLRGETGQRTPPFDLGKVAKLLRVHTVEVSDMAVHGELVPDERGFSLRINKSASGKRAYDFRP